MTIRRVQYSIDFIHILTFKEEYKKAVIPYFGFDGLKYGVDNENTLNESIRLYFELERFAIILKKEAITILYDGDANDLKSQNGVMKTFWEMYERIKGFDGYKKSTKHQLICHSVDLLDTDKYNRLIQETPHMTVNPFPKIDDFGCVYEFKNDTKNYKFEFGNFTKNDIKIHELGIFNSEFNRDLTGEALGLMCKVEIREKVNSPSFSKFKDLLGETERLIESYDKKV